MKKVLLFLLVALATTTYSLGYKITGKISSLPSGKVYLSKYDGLALTKIDSTVSKDGKFEFKGEVDMPYMVSIWVKDSNSKQGSKKITSFFLENSEVTISNSATNANEIIVTGSKENDIYSSNLLTLRSVGLSKIDSIIIANPKSYAVTYLFSNLYVPYVQSAKTITEKINMFDPAVNNSVYLARAKETAERVSRTEAGNKFIDFVATDPSGNEIAFSSVAGNGKWVLLDFWAAWCGPCRGENPNVVEAYNKYSAKGFTVFGYSLDTDGGKWKAAIIKDGLLWTNVSDLKGWENKVSPQYAVQAIPANFLIAPDGTIAAKNLRGEELMKKLEEVFSGK